MDYRFVSALFLLYHTKDADATCGSLTYKEPAIQGMNVTLVFRPDHFQSDRTPIVKYDITENDRQSREFPFDIHDKVYYIYVDTAKNIPRSSVFYVVYEQCFSSSTTLILMKLEDCGYLYVRTQPVIAGRNLDLGYFPAPAVISLKDLYCRKWFNVTSQTVMSLSDGLLSETDLTNKEFVLTIHNVTSSGRFSVKCTEGRDKDKYTNIVDVSVIVPPGRPSLHSNVHVDACLDCLVAKAERNLGKFISCNTTGGATLNVHLYIEKNNRRGQLSVNQSKDSNRYVPNYTVKSEDHMTRVVCSVENAAVDTPLITSAILYVAVKPQKPVLHVPTLKEGEPTNITCISKGGRPTSRLSIMIEGRNMSGSSETISVNDTTTNTNTIQMTLNVNAKREWNSKYIICTQKTDIFSDNESDRKLIKCKYPPSTLFMEKPRPARELKEAYLLTLRSNISDFNDNCSLNWNWDKSKLDGRKEQTNGLATLVVNATKEDNENTLICSVHCTSFQINLSDSYTIRVPFAPIVTLSSEQKIVLSEGEKQHVTCTVKSYPMSDILWTSGGTKRMQTCKQTNKCIVTLEHIAVDEQRNYTCTAKHLFKNVSKYVLVTGKAKQETRNTSITSGIVAGFGGLVLLTATVVLTIYLRKRKKRAKRPGRQNDTNVLQHVTREADSTPREEVTYAEVVKPRTLMTNRKKAVTKTKEKTTDTLIYADIDIEHLKAARTAVTKRTPSAPTEYSEIRFATRSTPARQENIYAN
ncbi:uncharacterized protein LOC128233809 isoform X2 [Mya arenaria]|uniref:uncharacterized protein LOC128233809 isoform X2 n=1 Tax=Mya arenaria TaxID=6604 RepID=UPI0022E69A7D|nr:uncharacterized protein LOC128233809 isoform X2 [Mya arenaria]